ncbi:Uncharacterised protein [Serratia liquefaciens]|uniref:hypothetical protein n=1 Tax=Serratia liquefaciens TaxID=614 RepID=UPI00217A38A3|nr:hypothetical protein [Serratia liquefaciens]CAI1699201.1 Uncharacterised protein [Serratia liquefaciens]HDS8357458.1 hypothetical protein [Serratia liquefaciens]
MNLTDKIALFSAIGGWVSGIATVMAVVVSLYLANRKPRSHIKGNVGLRVMSGNSFGGHAVQESGVVIRVTNHSVFPIIVNNIHWSFGQKTVLHQLFGDANSASLPKKLDYGEEAIFWIDNENDKWLSRFASELRNNNVNMRKFKCCVNLSTGKTISFKPEKEFLEELIKLMRNVDQANSSLQEGA